MTPPFNFSEYFRSLSFGGLAGAGIAGVIYLKVPYFHTITDLKTAMMCGGTVGAAAHRGVARLSEIVLHPVGRFLRDYEKQVELDLLLKLGRITPDQYRVMRAKLLERRLLGAPLPEPPKQELPPKP